MQENMDQKNSECGHFSRSEYFRNDFQERKIYGFLVSQQKGGDYFTQINVKELIEAIFYRWEE